MMTKRTVLLTLLVLIPVIVLRYIIMPDSDGWVVAWVAMFLAIFLCSKQVRERVLRTAKLHIKPLPTCRETITTICRGDVLRRIIVTLLLLTPAIFLGYVILPGIDRATMLEALDAILDNNPQVVTSYTSTSLIHRFSIASLGMMPFISANAFTVLAGLLIPPLRRRAAVSQAVRRRVGYSVLIITACVCCLQAWFLSQTFRNPVVLGFSSLESFLRWPELCFALSTMACLTLGTLLMVLCAKGINKYGMGHGVTLFLLLNSLSKLPEITRQVINVARSPAVPHASLALWAITAIATFAFAFICLRLSRTVSLGGEGEVGPIRIDIPLSLCGLFPFTFAMATAATSVLCLRHLAPLFHRIMPPFLIGTIVLIPLTVLYSRILFRSRVAVARLGMDDAGINRADAGRQISKALIGTAVVWSLVVIIVRQVPLLFSAGLNIPYLTISLPYLLAPIALLGLLQSLSRHARRMMAVYSHTEPLEMICARAYLAQNGIEASIHDEDIYGALSGYFIGTLANKELYVTHDDVSRAADLLEEYNMRKAVSVN